MLPSTLGRLDFYIEKYFILSLYWAVKPWKIDFYYNSFHINIGLVLITDNDEWYADYQLLVENLGRAKPDVLVMDYQYVLERKNFVSNLRRFLHVFVA